MPRIIAPCWHSLGVPADTLVEAPKPRVAPGRGSRRAPLQGTDSNGQGGHVCNSRRVVGGAADNVACVMCPAGLPCCRRAPPVSHGGGHQPPGSCSHTHQRLGHESWGPDRLPKGGKRLLLLVCFNVLNIFRACGSYIIDTSLNRVRSRLNGPTLSRTLGGSLLRGSTGAHPWPRLPGPASLRPFSASLAGEWPEFPWEEPINCPQPMGAAGREGRGRGRSRVSCREPMGGQSVEPRCAHQWAGETPRGAQRASPL